MAMPLARPTPVGDARPRSTSAPGYAAFGRARAANDHGPLRLPREPTLVRVGLAGVSAVLALGWLDAVARIAALAG